MANDGSVIIDIEGDSSKFKSALSGLGSIASTALKGVTTAIAAVTTAVAGVATAAVKVGSSFESSMSQVAATMGLTVEDIRNGSSFCLRPQKTQAQRLRSARPRLLTL